MKNSLLSDGQKWAIHKGDCIPHTMSEMPQNSVDFSVYSPPFPSIYSYSDSEADLGNVEDFTNESLWHFKYFFNGMLRVLKPGRVMMVHCMQIPRMKRAGGVGLHDFRGALIRMGERAGFIYEYDWLVRKNPQAQAIRTRSRELQFVGLEKDRAKTRGTLADYVIKFRKPGENAVPICDPPDTPILDELGEHVINPETGRPMFDDSHRQVTRDNWIQWAEAAWYDIKETDTLKVKGTKSEGDTKHICPLQLPVIERMIRLFSNPGELVFSPFAGIGSEGAVSLHAGRRFYGCELKEGYFLTATKNLEEAERVAAGGEPAQPVKPARKPKAKKKVDDHSDLPLFEDTIEKSEPVTVPDDFAIDDIF